MGVVATTPQGCSLLQPLWRRSQVSLWIPSEISSQFPLAPTETGTLSEFLTRLWPQAQSLVFSLALGAVVRIIVPLLEHKLCDPGVVVVDPLGKFVVSLCGGHSGGADQLTVLLARLLGATPVLTGAAQTHGLVIDQLGSPFGWRRGQGEWTAVSAAAARREPIQVIQTAGSTLWREGLPGGHPLRFGPDHQALTAQVVISPAQPAPSSPNLPRVHWHPRVLWIGVGCVRGAAKSLIADCIDQLLHAHQLAPEAVAGVATLDLKADEPGLVELCQERAWPLRSFSPDQLSQVSVPHPSSVVQNAVGTPSVAEAAALQGAGVVQLRVPKQVYRAAQGSVTLAIAQADYEYSDRPGRLWLVGTGPGDPGQVTPAAQGALSLAEVIIGYDLYLELIRPLTRPGQILLAWPITQERQRAEQAISLARRGLTVAVVSSGDCGVYGMAGLVLELLQAQGWDGTTPQVEVFPGISALQAVASRLGAPLMQDFCAISLSDLLVPWEVIEGRLQAAAQGDFVTVIYNPRSERRQAPLARAQRIFLDHRPPETPAAIVRCAYRDQEQVIITSLAELLDHPVDMLTTVLIGNRRTRVHQGWMITPRGYLDQKFMHHPGHQAQDNRSNQSRHESLHSKSEAKTANDPNRQGIDHKQE